jgi:hypothetical protein
MNGCRDDLFMLFKKVDDDDISRTVELNSRDFLDSLEDAKLINLTTIIDDKYNECGADPLMIRMFTKFINKFIKDDNYVGPSYYTHKKAGSVYTWKYLLLYLEQQMKNSTNNYILVMWEAR